jgi:hypothetical protein
MVVQTHQQMATASAAVSTGHCIANSQQMQEQRQAPDVKPIA